MSFQPLPVGYFDIEQAIMRDRHARCTIMPRFTPTYWWECDVCEITASGYFREYEIKMSRADFKVDAHKERRAGWNAPDPHAIENKHALLAAGDPRGPTSFCFVTPVGLLKPEEIPVWAGLVEITSRGDVAYPFETVVVAPPRLHKTKAPEDMKRRMLGACYGRLHHVWWENYYKNRCKRIEVADAVATA